MPSFPLEYYDHFPTLRRLEAPRATRVLAWLLLGGLAFVIAVMALVPWVQTAPGYGQVIALNPADRVQPITALVSGRVERWFVHDGERVRPGQPIAKIIDNDPQLIERLRDEREALLSEIESARASAASVENSVKVAQIDEARQAELFRAGLAARRDYELARIKVADGQAKLAEARAKIAEGRGKLNRIDVSLARQSVQLIRAPRSGRIQGIVGNAGGSIVSAGETLATLAPEEPVRVIELFIDGRDVALVHPGRRARLEFEGWPAIQISGWPAASNGLFWGRVRSVDPSAQANGLFRVLIEESPGESRWPGPQYIKLGAKVRGWIQMETVKVGYEIWRQVNDFPLEFRRPADEGAPTFGAGPAQQGAAKKAADKGGEDQAKK
ncbi:MAG: HlyD family efflux transporter periplasmic adaptor subunit [Sphingomonadaceae bacterium]|nr:HlyD family efflux transporter periplasmic adaptor subunit [Sphingomonadaceae bacterium]